MNDAAPLTSPAASLTVDLGSRAYEILIGPGLLTETGRRLAQLLPGARAMIVTDKNVGKQHLETVVQSLRKAGGDPAVLVLPAGERTKSFGHLEETVNAILAAKLERGDAVIALGGGVVGDLTGFASGIARRGMQFIQLPTSLLAQVDSSVGGKTGINTVLGKNLAGVFHQPAIVIADTAVLDTLPAREFRAGYAEIVKYGLIDRPDFFDWLEANREAVFAGGDERVHAIAESCRAKADVVRRDEFEAGERALLNLGHTFGHALEAATGFDASRIVHGEGVAIGMVLAHRFSARMNLASPDDADRVSRHLAVAGLPVSLADIPGGLPPADALLGFIAQDKKVTRGALTFILTRGIGQAFVAHDVPPSEVLAFLQENHPG